MADPNALLTGMRITYRTQNDDKDGDTRVEAWINMSGEREAAYVDVGGMHFDNNSTHIFDGQAKSNPMRRADIPGSWLQIRIDPNGNDRWVFECDLMLRFNDGTIHEQSFQRTTLDQNSRQANLMLVA
jgi:hypothetical protein